MVSNSDNTACDALIDLLGGPQIINNYMHAIGANDIIITVNEATMHKDSQAQYTNWCEPQQMMYLLYNLYNGKYLSKPNTDLLIKLMQATNTSAKRIKGLLPEGTVVARKSGSSGTNKAGMTAASNDVGIIYLPNSKHLIMAAFVSDAKAKDSVIDLTIARIAKAAYDNSCNNKSLQ
jgi:beta-lactamase class A